MYLQRNEVVCAAITAQSMCALHVNGGKAGCAEAQPAKLMR